jgi:YgiT-type zinc finger domain-containing protein
MEIRECEFCHSREIVRTVVNEVYPSSDEYFLIENIPVWRCTQCGERYYEATVLVKVERLLEKRTPVLRTVQMPVLAYN